MNRRPLRGWAIGFVALAAAIAGCSDDGDDGSTTDAPVATDAAATSATTTAVPGAATAAPDATTATPAPSESAATTAPAGSVVTTAPALSVPRLAAGDVVLGDAVAEPGAPTTLAVRPGDDTFYIAGRMGMVWGWTPGGELTEMLDMRSLTEGSGEQGLLGLAFSPDGSFAYVDYTGADDGGNTHVDEYAIGVDGTFDVASRRELLVVDQPFANHNGGQLAFGPDGMLYIGLGDGGGAGDPDRRALDLGDLLGKILRIDPAGDPYTVPTDNPFVADSDARGEIWTYGLRNPWRFSFDPATGDLWIGDVGQGEIEEIDLAVASDRLDAGKGLNFGWSVFEGSVRYNDDQPEDDATGPFFEYSHDEGCSVTGGEVYRGTSIPALVDWYVFADYCQGTIWALEITTGDGGAPAAGERIELAQSSDVSAIEVGPDGELYVLSLTDGMLPLLPA